jgi:hypothetical protein
MTSKGHPLERAKLEYILKSSMVKSIASCPPAPAEISKVNERSLSSSHGIMCAIIYIIRRGKIAS